MNLKLENELIGTLKRAGDTHWSSHFQFICSLVRLFNATCSVLENIINEGSTYSQRGDANAAFKMITSFQFIFILHLMKEIMGNTDGLCQHLQRKSRDVLIAVQLVAITKKLIQKLRDEDWDSLLEEVVSFYKKFEIDILNATIDFQLQELDNRF
jgi:hypothetical protein